jgi:hypothetical protein
VLELAELARARSELREAAADHVPSIEFFRNAGDSSFYKTAKHVAEAAAPDGELHGITTTFTCIESLNAAGAEGVALAQDTLANFVPFALAHPDEWESEGAAKVYCRVRALTPLIALSPALDDTAKETIAGLLNYAWQQVSLTPGSDAIFEVDTGPNGEANRYPPNAYLTYFGLAALNGFEGGVEDAARKRLIAESWLEKSLASQVTLHYHHSPLADPQQLAWSICGVARFRDQAVVERVPPTTSLLEAGLDAFFSQQRDGIWSRGEPLFHYREAGNAYCYVFETLAELIELAVDGSVRASVLRRMLQPYAPKLLESFRYLMATKRPLPNGHAGWCSGHHPHRTSPESWATACVFRFLQGARQLFGMWTRDEAARLLGARKPRGGWSVLQRHGSSWNAGWGSSGTRLSTLFIHPLLAEGALSTTHDPDAAIIHEKGARSAILYGPPGTGKTSLAEAVAACLEWDFVEVTPAVFLDRGVELVSARADEVFRQIMELDRCVVLFDEIDELIRTRDQRSDPLERFFTTTMLPRLAKLWDQGKVLFFVNTNGIREVDPAVRRSNRFDAAIFVLPPSFDAKVDALAEEGVTIALTRDRVDVLLEHDHEDGDLPDDHPFNQIPAAERDVAWFALITHEQVERLASRLPAGGAALGDVPDATLAAELRPFGLELSSADWWDPSKEDVAQMTRVAVLQRFRDLQKEQRLDHRRRRVVQSVVAGDPPPHTAVVHHEGDDEHPVDDDHPAYWVVDVPEADLELWAAGAGLVIDSCGCVRAEQ